MWPQSCEIEGPCEGYHIRPTTCEPTDTHRSSSNTTLVTRVRIGIDVHIIAPFLKRTSLVARQFHGIHMEFLRYGIERPLRSVPRRKNNHKRQNWSNSCAYMASHLGIKELSFNINFTIPQDFQRFGWVPDVTQTRGLKVVFHRDRPNKHGLK